MKGWKTWTGFGIFAGSQVLDILGYGGISEMTRNVGGAFMGVGVAHKIEKSEYLKAEIIKLQEKIQELQDKISGMYKS